MFDRQLIDGSPVHFPTAAVLNLWLNGWLSKGENNPSFFLFVFVSFAE